MTDPTPARATVSADGRTVTLTAGAHILRMPAEDLPSWLAMHRDLADRRNGAYAKFHQTSITALERAQRVLATYQRSKP